MLTIYDKPLDYSQDMRSSQGASFIWSNGQRDIQGRLSSAKIKGMF